MKTLLLLSFASFTLTTVAGCSKPSGDAPSGAVTTTSANANAPGAKATTGTDGPKVITLTKFGLKGSAPGETEDPIIGDGDPAMVMASAFTVNVWEAKATDPKKLKDGQEASKLFNPKNSQSETLPDGWALTYENTGSAGTNYFVSVRREIGGKGYMCETAQSTPEQQKKSLAFCKSLSK